MRWWRFTLSSKSFVGGVPGFASNRQRDEKVEIACMENLQEQELKIEGTRNRLRALVAAKGFDMQDPDVILLSHELDCLIADFEKAKQLAK